MTKADPVNKYARIGIENIRSRGLQFCSLLYIRLLIIDWPCTGTKRTPEEVNNAVGFEELAFDSEDAVVRWNCSEGSTTIYSR
jgi:hypothetical protein